MADRRTTFWTSLSPRRRRIWLVGILLAALFGGGAGQILPDAGLRWGVVKLLRSAGMTEVSLAGANLSLFKGAVVVRGVAARPEAGSEFDLAGLLFDFRWQPLFSRRVSVEALELQGVNIDLSRDGDGWEVNGLPLPAASGEASAWSFDVDRMLLTASRLTITDGAVAIAVDLDELSVSNLNSWDASAPVQFHMAGSVNGAAVTLTGSATPFAEVPGFSMTVTADRLDLAPFARAMGVARLAGRLSGELSLTGSVQPADVPVLAEGRLNAGDLAVEWPGNRVSAALAGWNGKAEWQGAARIAGRLTAERVAVASGGSTVGAAKVSLEAEKAEWDSRKGSLAGALRAEGIEVAAGDTGVTATTGAWKGAAAVAADGTIKTRGSLEAEVVRVRYGGRIFEHGRAGVAGTLDVVAPAAAVGVMPPLGGNLDAWAEDLAVHEPTRQLAAVQRIEAKGLALSPTDGASLGEFEAYGLKALSRAGRGGYGWRIEAGRIALARAGMNTEGDLFVSRLHLASPIVRILRTEGGFAGFSGEVAGNGDEAALPKVQLGRLLVTKGRVEFDDRTPSEPVRLTVEGVRVTARELDTASPQHDSPFTLEARAGNSHLTASGSVRPFEPRLTGSLKGRIKSFDLPPLSPYAADSLGVHLHTGQFDGDVTLAVADGDLDGRMELVLAQLFVAQPDPNAPIAKQADMSIETILDLLRDSEDRIRLTIPVRGNLASPDFDVSDAVAQAVGGALKSTVLTTLKVAFPVVALIGLVIDDASHYALEPLDFLAGEHELADAHIAKLAAVAELMRQRPGLKLTLCGVATVPADWPVLLDRRRAEELGIFAKLQKLMGTAPRATDVTPDRDQLAELADRRAQALKTWLVEREALDAGRLFTCRPQVDTEGKGAPRVDLLL